MRRKELASNLHTLLLVERQLEAEKKALLGVKKLLAGPIKRKDAQLKEIRRQVQELHAEYRKNSQGDDDIIRFFMAE